MDGSKAEAINLEPIAISLHESHARSVGGGRLSWLNETPMERLLWRNRARSVVKEATDQNKKQRGRTNG